MKRSAGYLPVVLAALVAAPGWVRSDEVVFKTGRAIEGVITEETDTHVVLDLGGGSMTIARRDVESIRRSSGEGNDALRDAWRRKYILHGRNTPRGMRDLASAYRALTRSRNDAVLARKTLRRAEQEERAVVAVCEELRRRLVDVSGKLESASPEADVRAYNALVLENNKIRAGLTLKQDGLVEVRGRANAAAERVAGYQRALVEFDARVRARADEPATAAGGESRALFLETLGAKLARLDEEFSRTAIDTTSSGGSTIVTARINDRLTARFILDTGAAIVTISPEIAARLGLEARPDPSRSMVLADGRRVAGRPVTLASVQLGKARVEHVAAAVLPSPMEGQVDGLLGMSFLKHFVMNLDGSTGRLELKQFRPGP